MNKDGLIERMYYEAGGDVHEIDVTDGEHIINIPSSVTKVHVVDADDRDMEIDLNRIPARVSKAMIAADRIRMLGNVRSNKAIKTIEYLGENDVVTGQDVIEEDVYELSGVREIPDDTLAVRVVYEGGKKCKVVMDDDSSLPKSSSVYVTGEGKIAVTLEDPAGVARVEYYDGAGVGHVIDIAGNPEIKSLEMDGEINRIIDRD